MASIRSSRPIGPEPDAASPLDNDRSPRGSRFGQTRPPAGSDRRPGRRCREAAHTSQRAPRAPGRPCPSPARSPPRLVGERSDGRLSGRPAVVGPATQVHRRGQPGAPIATLTTPVRQARPNVSVTTTPTADPERRRSPCRMRSARGVGVLAAAAPACPSSTFEASTPAFAHTNPCRVSAITRSPRRATTRAVSASTAAASIVLGHHPALGLRHDLLRDDHDVAVARVRRRSEHRRQSMVTRSSPGTTSGIPSIR